MADLAHQRLPLEDDDPELISERIVITLPPALLQRVQDYRFANRFNSQSASVRKLIELGLIAAGWQEKKKKPQA